MEVEVFGMAGIPEGAVPGGLPSDGAEPSIIIWPCLACLHVVLVVHKCRQRICVHLLPLLNCPRESLQMARDSHSVEAASSISPVSACFVHF